MLKVFIDENDIVVADYPADAEVADTAHGPAASPFLIENADLPAQVPIPDGFGFLPRRMPEGWRAAYQEPVPARITFAQLRMGLRRFPSKVPNAPVGRTMRADFDDLIDACRAGAAPGFTLEQQGDLVDLCEYGNDIYRNGVTVLVVAASFKLSPSEVDQLFRVCGKLGD